MFGANPRNPLISADVNGWLVTCCTNCALVLKLNSRRYSAIVKLTIESVYTLFKSYDWKLLLAWSYKVIVSVDSLRFVVSPSAAVSLYGDGTEL